MNRASYDLTRLRRNGLITRVPRPQPLPTHRRRPRVRDLLHQGPQPRAATADGHRPTEPHHRCAPPCAPSTHTSTPDLPRHDFRRRPPDTLTKCQSPSDQGSLGGRGRGTWACMPSQASGPGLSPLLRTSRRARPARPARRTAPVPRRAARAGSNHVGTCVSSSRPTPAAAACSPACLPDMCTPPGGSVQHPGTTCGHVASHSSTSAPSASSTSAEHGPVSPLKTRLAPPCSTRRAYASNGCATGAVAACVPEGTAPSASLRNANTSDRSVASRSAGRGGVRERRTGRGASAGAYTGRGRAAGVGGRGW